MKPIQIKLEDSDQVAEITMQQPADVAGVERLLNISFGPNRQQKTAYRLRDNVEPVDELCFVARLDGKLVGTLRFWPSVIKTSPEQEGGVPALLLGPIAVDPPLKGKGVGIGLMHHGINRARETGHKLIVLVGDANYYRRVGFRQVPPGQLTMPGPVDVDRLLYLELVDGAMKGVRGQISSIAKE